MNIKADMSEVNKDPKIKLFGKTIGLPENSVAAADDSGGESGSARSCEAAVGDSSNLDPPCSSDSMLEDSNFLSGDAEEQESIKPRPVPEQDYVKEDKEELKDSNATPPIITNQNGPEDDSGVKNSKTEDDQTDTSNNSNSNDKALKKPDKILPCPRCNSMDTKFCYFNNYNVNQPRHFCKNCQRYWTAGGTMRNVPVGAGRRKNKNSSISQFSQLMGPDALRVDLPIGLHHHHSSLSPNGTVLTFGPDSSSLYESTGSVLKNANKSVNGLGKPEENGDDRSTITSTTDEPVPNHHLFPPPQVPCYPGPNWAYPWNPVQWGPASFPVPFYSAAAPPPPPYWGWNVPFVIPSGPAPNLPTLGKHSRDDDNTVDDLKNDTKEETVKESNPKKCLWVPKTLRIDDPDEAAKSSIWATLGIKNDGLDSSGIFKAFRSEPKEDKKAHHVSESSTVLHANPAAMSRSLSFHESS
ncbi:hypothetical protein CASFOL_032842 [Castilleja foliolosa]|uniref:Dof-type domain-containing protein n=1 Tax=Castilleja foliolosa TaxID=1961234 RepID=A0ABD3C4E3_9LAMI